MKPHPFIASFRGKAVRRDADAGFTLIELCVAVAILLVLSSLALSVAGEVQTTTNRTVCMNNMRVLCSAILSYAADHDGAFPSPLGDSTAPTWDGMVFPYLNGGVLDLTQPCKTLRCPEDKRPLVIDAGNNTFPRSYKISSQPADSPDSPMGVLGYWTDADGNTAGMSRKTVQLSAPSDTILLYECFTPSGSTTPIGYESTYQYHSSDSMGGGWNSGPRLNGYRPDGSKKLYHDTVLNYGMCDGHVEAHDLVWPYTPHNRWNAVR